MKFSFPEIRDFNMNSSVDLSLKKALKTPPTRRTAEVKTPTEIPFIMQTRLKETLCNVNNASFYYQHNKKFIGFDLGLIQIKYS